MELKHTFKLFAIIILLSNAQAENNTTSFYEKKNTCSVAIDVGHSPINYGATSAMGVTEYDFNLKFAQALLKHLENMKIEVYPINQASNEVILEERAIEVNTLQPTMMISIHHDTVLNRFMKKWEYKGKKLKYCDVFKGYSIFVSKQNSRFVGSMLLADAIGRNLYLHKLRPNYSHAMKLMGENKRFVDSRLGIYRYDDSVVLKNSSVPAVLLQVGVIVNRNEEMLLSEPNYINAYSKLVAESIKESCGKLISN